MKRLLLVILVVALCITVAACGSVEQTPTTVPRSTSSSATLSTATTTSPTTEATPTTTVAAVAATTTTSSKTGTTKRTYETHLATTSPTFANGEGGDLLAKLPWTVPPHVPFYGEKPNKLHAPVTRVLFSNRDYSLIGGHYSLYTLFFDDGSQHDGDELEALLTEGKISIDDVVTLFGVTPNTNAATDVATGEARFGEMISYRRGREATVKQGHAEVHIYPPFDFFGEFFTDDRRSDSVGYYVNAAYLNQIIQAACPSARTLDTAEAIRVGDSLFVPLSAAEELDITVNVGERNEESPSNTPSLQIVLPSA